MKKIVIMRGVPGSGKSTKVKEYIASYKATHTHTPFFHICSADHFFVDEAGNYKFDATKLGEAHRKCQKEAEHYLSDYQDVIVIIDNTNLVKKEYQVYIDLAAKYDAEVEFVMPDDFIYAVEADSVKLRESYIHLFAQRNVHNVPEDKIRQMFEKFMSDKLPKKEDLEPADPTGLFNKITHDNYEDDVVALRVSADEYQVHLKIESYKRLFIVLQEIFGMHVSSKDDALVKISRLCASDYDLQRSAKDIICGLQHGDPSVIKPLKPVNIKIPNQFQHKPIWQYFDTYKYFLGQITVDIDKIFSHNQKIELLRYVINQLYSNELRSAKKEIEKLETDAAKTNDELDKLLTHASVEKGATIQG